MSRGKNQHVVPHADGWAVKGAGNRKATTVVSTQKEAIRIAQDIAREHVQNNTSVRNMLGERGIKPEELPPEEDLKKLERRVKSTEKKMIKGCELPETQDEEK